MAARLLPLLLLLLLPHSCALKTQIPITRVTARTQWGPGYYPERVTDGVIHSSHYHSGTDGDPEWLRLELERPSMVTSVVVVNR